MKEKLQTNSEMILDIEEGVVFQCLALARLSTFGLLIMHMPRQKSCIKEQA